MNIRFLGFVASLVLVVPLVGIPRGSTRAARSTINGPIVFMRGPDYITWTMSPDGTALRRISDRPTLNASGDCPSGSSDGRRLAFVGGSDSAGTEIFRMRSDGTEITRLTRNDVDDLGPDWSPTEQRLVFSRGTGGAAELFLMRADGKRQRQITDLGRYSYGADWSPDGKRIVFHSAAFRQHTQLDIFTVTADGDNIRRLTHSAKDNAASLSPAWSPDGRRILYSRSNDGDGEIFVMARDGSNKRRLTKNSVVDTDPTWSPDGRFIVFARLVQGKFQIFKMTADGDNVRRLSDGDRSDRCPEWLNNG